MRPQAATDRPLASWRLEPPEADLEPSGRQWLALPSTPVPEGQEAAALADVLDALGDTGAGLRGEVAWSLAVTQRELVPTDGRVHERVQVVVAVPGSFEALRLTLESDLLVLGDALIDAAEKLAEALRVEPEPL